MPVNLLLVEPPLTISNWCMSDLVNRTTIIQYLFRTKINNKYTNLIMIVLSYVKKVDLFTNFKVRGS